MWFPTRFTVRPRSEDVVLQQVDGATLTRFSHGEIPVAKGRPDRYVSGAVYDADDRLVRRSQRVGGWKWDHAISVDTGRIPEYSGEVRELSGTWLYGGTWFCHFGHFLTETTTTLWPQVDVDGVVFHPFWFGRERLPYQTETLRLLGLPPRPSIVGPRRLRVERLLVPTRPYVANGYALPEGVQVWDRLREAALAEVPSPGTELVYLSRTGLNRARVEDGAPSRRSLPNDDEVDALAARLGFTVVEPQELSYPEQIALAAGARVLAGPSGSALHLSVFAGPSTAVLELADARGAQEPVLTQQVLGHARGQRLGYVPLARGPEGHDLGQVEERLAGLLEAAQRG